MSSPSILKSNLFEDPSEGIINQRINVALGIRPLEILDISSQTKQEYFDFLLLFSIKLGSMWNHYKRFEKELERLLQNPPIVTLTEIVEGEAHYSQILFSEFDGYLVQYKSSLDYLSYVPAIFYGRKWTLKTFKAKGEGFLTALKRNLPKEHISWVEYFEKKIFPEYKPFIVTAIEMRDEFNHYLGGDPKSKLGIKPFLVCREIDKIKKTDRLIQPMAGIDSYGDQVTLIEHIHNLFFIHLGFCESVLHLLLIPFLKPGFTVGKVLPHSKTEVSPWVFDKFDFFEKLAKAEESV